MSRSDVLKRYLDAGLELVSLAQSRADELQSRAEELVKELVRSGEVQADQARDAVAELVERSRQSSERLLETIRAEVREQVTALSLASQSDLDRLEQRVSELVSSATANLRSVAKKAPGKKAAATKGPAKKAPAKKAAKSPYGAKFLEQQRQALLEERARYTRQAETLRAEADALMLDRDPGDVQFDEESGEGDTVAVERERDLALSAQAQAAVEEIDAALARIDAGTYGICVTSGETIPKERLEAIPWAAETVEVKVGGFGRR